jgi:hypothetical protein
LLSGGAAPEGGAQSLNRVLTKRLRVHFFWTTPNALITAAARD